MNSPLREEATRQKNPMVDEKHTDVPLTKSLYLKGLRCYKSLYLNRHHPELKERPHPSLKTRKRNNERVSLAARALFPGGIQVPPHNGSYREAMERTAAAIAGGANIIYDGAFIHEGLYVTVDILRKGKRGWKIYEVKDAARVKDLYVEDVALQHFVLRGSLLPIAKARVLHINRDYVRNGNADGRELFRIRDVTEEAGERQTFVEMESEKQKKILEGPLPDIDIDRHCYNIEECGFKGFCWKHIPEDSVFSLRGKGADKLALYKQGIVHLKDVPLGALSYNQRLQVVATLTRKDFIFKERLRDFLDSLWYPLCFLDFETYMDPIPPFSGTRPYQQIPFQYSLHYMEREEGKVAHREFLADPFSDPREEMARKLLGEIPEGACVLVYGRSFETEVLRNMGRWFPDLAEKIESIIPNIVDLALPFRRRDVYFWKMRGSTSLKMVLPALVPGLSYTGLEFSDGGSAMEGYYGMRDLEDDEEIERVRMSLLDYCRLDTMGMVQVLERLKSYVQ